MGDGQTKVYPAVIPGGVAIPEVTCAALMVKSLTVIAENEFSEAKDVSCQPGGKFLLAAKRSKDGLWVALQVIPRVGYKDELKRGKPRRQILGLRMAGNQPLYVGWPENPADNRPRVCWGDSEGKPYDAVNSDELQWPDGEPLYLASLAGGEFVVRGTREGKLYSEIIPPLLFVAGRPLYRARFNRKMHLVWGEAESRPCDDISVPTVEGKMIMACAAEGTKIYSLTIKTA
jgi:hypothetical protein